jgi:predicted RNase H-like nuclease (RuvC/YqgF family)
LHHNFQGGSIIIGIDAGATFAFAALDFNGNLIAIRSKRNIKREEIIRMLEPFEPVIIACDTNPPSKLGKFLSTTFGCRLSFPPKSLTEMEKNKMTKPFNYKNTHEKDALAAGLKAYFKIANKMRQVERHLREEDSRRDEQAAKQLVASGRRMADL